MAILRNLTEWVLTWPSVTLAPYEIKEAEVAEDDKAQMLTLNMVVELDEMPDAASPAGAAK